MGLKVRKKDSKGQDEGGLAALGISFFFIIAGKPETEAFAKCFQDSRIDSIMSSDEEDRLEPGIVGVPVDGDDSGGDDKESQSVGDVIDDGGSGSGSDNDLDSPLAVQFPVGPEPSTSLNSDRPSYLDKPEARPVLNMGASKCQDILKQIQSRNFRKPILHKVLRNLTID
jgi:hypothetical protein